MRVQTVGSISDFMSFERTDIKKAIKKFNKKAAAHRLKASLTTLATGATAIAITNKMFSSPVYAAASDAMPVWAPIDGAKELVVDAFMPLVDVIQALAYPIASVMLTGGAILFMINQKDKGIGLIQNASIGYILVQLMPVFLKILVGIGGAIG